MQQTSDPGELKSSTALACSRSLGRALVDDEGHLAGLLKKGEHYYVVNNVHLEPVTVGPGTEPRQALLARALGVYDHQFPASPFRVYYADAETDGALPEDLYADMLAYRANRLNPSQEKTRNRSLESNGPK